MRIRRFRLSEQFLEPYKTAPVDWGYNGLGYVTYKRTYARRLDELDPPQPGTEEWWQTCRRVIEGMFTMQKQHVVELGLEWNDAKAQRTAKDAYERLFKLKWTPPGRGLWMMGTKFVEERTAAGLFNCAFRSTKDLKEKGGYLFRWIMDALMVGIGVGFDTKGAGTLLIKEPGSVSTNPRLPNNTVNQYLMNEDGVWTCIIDDSREGWVESIQVLLDAYYFGHDLLLFDYSRIRGEGEPIKGFGGTSSGPAPLEQLHEDLVELYGPRDGQLLRSIDIVDTENLIGKCVVAGNVRRSAALAMGEANDIPYLEMKNDKEKLLSHRWGSNNSFSARLGMDYSWHAAQSQVNGEPGVIWLENARTRGRFKDPVRLDDLLVMGFNPCVEQQLEDGELCCLTETFPAKHDSLEDYLQTLKIAYLYGKTVTLARTQWPETNAKMQKNRRIGLSMSGVVQAFNKIGRHELFKWCDQGYEYVQELDAMYSDWLCIPRSKRTTSIKPSGTVSLLNGSTPGVHFPEDEFYIRRIRIATNHDMIPVLEAAGYPIEDCIYSPNTKVVSFPVKEPHFVKGKRQVSMWEQLEIAAQMQYWWADNSVSVTVTFKPEEGNQIADALELYQSRLKAVSFLKYEETGYDQAPYEPISERQYLELAAKVTPVQRLDINTGGAGTKFCTTDQCEINWIELAKE
jgi:ribonucleoside-triphosphate reductase (thioredoxin)